MACSLACRLPILACLSFAFITSHSCIKDGQQVPCAPGQDACGRAFQDAPSFHLMSQRGCGENDPNGPVFDPVHGVIHHFYQDHLAAGDGQGPIYGHFVSKDFVHWAELPVAIWNGLDASSDPPLPTLYDTVAIYTGSAVVLDGAGPHGAPGIVQIYPGLCDKRKWPGCASGAVLAQAVPADYGDQLLTNWTKPLYNPIMENVQRDPSTPWKEQTTGEWRLRTFDGEFYGSASDSDLLRGKWYRIGPGDPTMWPTCECPSFFPLPGPTPGFEKDFMAKVLPSHVQKISCQGKDWWMLGTYTLPNRSAVGSFVPTAGWEDLYARRQIDAGAFYASKDALYPDATGLPRRINWGWARVQPASAQSLPRVITFNPRARQLEQAPLPELEQLRGQRLVQENVKVIPSEASLVFRLPFLSAQRSETLVRFNVPKQESLLRVGFRKPHVNAGAGRSPNFGGVKLGHPEVEPLVSCAVHYKPVHGVTALDAVCGNVKDSFVLLEEEQTLELRIFADTTMLEVFFQRGRSVMTLAAAPSADAELFISSTVETSATVAAYAMKSIWVSEEYIRKQARVYPSHTDIWS